MMNAFRYSLRSVHKRNCLRSHQSTLAAQAAARPQAEEDTSVYVWGAIAVMLTATGAVAVCEMDGTYEERRLAELDKTTPYEEETSLRDQLQRMKTTPCNYIQGSSELVRWTDSNIR